MVWHRVLQWEGDLLLIHDSEPVTGSKLLDEFHRRRFMHGIHCRSELESTLEETQVDPSPWYEGRVHDDDVDWSEEVIDVYGEEFAFTKALVLFILETPQITLRLGHGPLIPFDKDDLGSPRMRQPMPRMPVTTQVSDGLALDIARHIGVPEKCRGHLAISRVLLEKRVRMREYVKLGKLDCKGSLDMRVLDEDDYK